MKTKHTPGPWRAAHITGNGIMGRLDHWDVMSGDQLVSTSYRCNDEHIANARLIAAAPELLEALIGLVLVHGDYSDEVSAAHAAIRKAMGEEE